MNWTVTGTLCPDGIVAGSVSPRMANSEFVDWSDDMVTAAFEAVSVACRLALDPTVTLPKLRVAGLTANCGFTGATPVPVKVSAVGEPVALLVNPAWPVAVPEALGVNRTVTGTLCPAAIVTGSVSPRMANCEFVDWSDEMVTAAFEAVSAACRLALDPTVTLPKLSVAGVTASCAVAADKPVPVTCMYRGDFGSLLTSVI